MGLHRDTVGNVVQVRQRTGTGRLCGNEIEVLVVAFNPIQRGTRSRIRSVFRREVAGTNPERNLRMTRHHAIERVEVAVKIADCTEEHVIGV